MNATQCAVGQVEAIRIRRAGERYVSEVFGNRCLGSIPGYTVFDPANLFNRHDQCASRKHKNRKNMLRGWYVAQ